MITMTREENAKNDEGPFFPEEAVEYLRRKHGIVMSVTALRARRLRGTTQAKRVSKRNSLWTKEELDNIKAAPQTKRVPPED